jgi:hypothetical protein
LAGQRSKRRSRKRHTTASAPTAVTSPRRAERTERRASAASERARAQRQLGTEGERPPSPFGGLPVAEIAIFAGLVAIIVWLIRGGTATLVVGFAVTALGVVEFTAREHFSGYRSHTSLLAAIPSLAIGIGVISAVGDKADRAPLLLAVSGSLFALLFWFLRRRFQIARQARVVRSRR